MALMAVIKHQPVGVDGTGGCAEIVVPTTGGNVVPGTEGTGGPDVTPGGPVDGTAGLTPAKRDISALVCCCIISIETILAVLPCILLIQWLSKTYCSLSLLLCYSYLLQKRTNGLRSFAESM